MVASPNKEYKTPEEYFLWEEQQPLKYEYIDGEVFAMTGGTIPHGTIAANVFYHLKGHLRGGTCRVFVFDVKVGVSEQGTFHYPDLMVSCDPRNKDAIKVIYYPCLLAEVLSSSTEAFDRGRKFAHYRGIQTLQEYLLIDAERMTVECFRRGDRGQWTLTAYNEGEDIDLTSVNFRCPIEWLYEDIQL